MNDAESEKRVLIRMRDISRAYTLGATVVHALRGVSFDVCENEYIAIIGPSGSGKSTLMNLVGCLDTPTGGEYRLDGKLVSEMDDDELAWVRNYDIGFIFQTFNLLARKTARRNVEMPLIYAGIPRKDRATYAEQALAAVGLEDRGLHRPNEMSGGQRQRVAIARALVTQPSILLADEPTGNLDTATGLEIMNLFDNLHAAGNTIIVVTHNIEVAEYAHRVITIRDGKIESDERQTPKRGHDAIPSGGNGASDSENELNKDGSV